jgi:hypothetical protein
VQQRKNVLVRKLHAKRDQRPWREDNTVMDLGVKIWASSGQGRMVGFRQWRDEHSSSIREEIFLIRWETGSSARTLFHRVGCKIQPPGHYSYLICFPHSVHMYGRSPVCVRMCTLRLCFSEKYLPHWAQPKGRTPANSKVVLFTLNGPSTVTEHYTHITLPNTKQLLIIVPSGNVLAWKVGS